MLDMKKPFPLDFIPKIQDHPDDYRMLMRIPYTTMNFGLSLPVVLSNEAPVEKMVIVDTETTGFEHDSDKVIELGLVEVSLSSTGSIVSINRYYGGFQDPGVPLKQEIKEVTGIDDSMLKGQSFDIDEINSFFTEDPRVVSHNAKFDRAFFDSTFPHLSNLRWGCSIKGIDWQQHGVSTRALTGIANHFGYFYDAHRAIVDCLALVWLLHKVPNVMQNLIASMEAFTIKLSAEGSPYSAKDTLKSWDFSWDGVGRVWVKEIKPDELTTHLSFLDNTYPLGSQKAKYHNVDARLRFKP